jgi:hypothetical protein
MTDCCMESSLFEINASHARSAQAPALLTRQLPNLQGRSAGALAHAIFASVTWLPPSQGKTRARFDLYPKGTVTPFVMILKAAEPRRRQETVAFSLLGRRTHRIDLGQISAGFFVEELGIRNRADRNATGKPESTITIAIDD